MLLVQVIVGLLAALMLALSFAWRLRRRQGTLHVRHYAWPRSWLGPLERHVPVYRRMPFDMREALQDRMLEFIDGKQWRADGGLEEVTLEMKIVVAAHACALLAVFDPTNCFREILTVRIFPEDQVPSSPEDREALLTCEGSAATVMMAWDARNRTAADLRDRDNPELDEALERFAGPTGQQVIRRPLRHSAWARAACDAWRAAQARLPVAAGGRGDEDTGVLLPAGEEEFVAATELFFQAPQVLQRHQPATYQSLRAFFRMDPARWRSPA